MVVHKATVQVQASVADYILGLLDGSKVDSDTSTLIHTARFQNGYEADIKVVRDADSPYIDPVLFDPSGHEVSCLQDESQRIEGEYQFDLADGDSYIVVVERTS